jgi:endonuclease/exonuclease/phosphatase family metal-dependent hydrolase
MLHFPEVFLRRFRNYFSRSKWLIRLGKLPYVPERQQKPGLIMIQIDALSRQQLEAAIEAGRMPFLKRLLTRQHYKLRTHYSGMPCCTPAVQGELFYGVRGGVPSFSFYDVQDKRTFTMFNPPDAEAIQVRLEKQGTGLFEGGSCYSNIFTGGAAEPHFCVADLNMHQIFGQWRTLNFAVTVLLHVFSLLRAAVLLVIEFVIAVVDFFRGLIDGRDLGKELKFVPSRVAICILLREVIVIGAKMDITRGLPIIQANLMGYHEQSHRRGATSRFAHWTLKGIDDAIERIWRSARHAEKHYELWIYSDHGQVDTIPYESTWRESIQETVNNTLKAETEFQWHSVRQNRPGFLNRLGWRLQKMRQGQFEAGNDEKIRVTALGPYALIYLDEENRTRKRACAVKLLETGKIPVVLIPEKQNEKRSVRILTKNAEYVLPDEADAFFQQHAFVPSTLGEDVVNACHHPDAGDLIVCGYQRPGAPYFSFATENGSHGGLDEHEYRGFFLGPKKCEVDTAQEYVRPLDIRHGAFRVLGRAAQAEQVSELQALAPEHFRIMTYNVHTCVGMDGKLSPLRIAKVIEQYNPDIVALQELDVGRKRTKHHDQAKIISDILEMDHYFSPAIAMEEEQYGDAILSRFPMRLVKADILPGNENAPRREPRGALWVEITIGSKKIQVFNTHLGLILQEQREQVQALMGPEWLANTACNGPVVFCGDFNFTPRSKLYQQCRERFNAAVPAPGPRGTYCGRYPLIRLDHIFYTQEVVVQACKTGDTDMARIASDHRPLIAEFTFSAG